MPTELQIIRFGEFVRVGPEGQFDMAASKAVLAELVGACRKRGIHHALLDLRALHPGPTPVFTPSDLGTLVRTFREIGFTHEDRLAVLYSEDPHHRAVLFAFISNVRGWNVGAFGNFEQALLWLSSGDASNAEAGSVSGEQKIPVQTRPATGDSPAPKQP